MKQLKRMKKQLPLIWSILLLWSVFQPSSIFAQQSIPQSANDQIHSWFYQYDQIRRAAQMSPAERQQADQILGKGLALFMPGQDKIVAQKLLADLVKRYEIACQQLGSLQIIYRRRNDYSEVTISILLMHINYFPIT